MKLLNKTKTSTLALLCTFLLGQPLVADVSKEELASISTPNKVETSIGTLKFIDGAPLPETAQKAYDYLDTMRAVDVFLKAMPAASVAALMNGPHSIGADASNKVMIDHG